MTDDSAEWGPWIVHDGAHIPTDFAVGDVVQVQSEDNETGALEISLPRVVRAVDFIFYNWIWGEGSHDTVAYRIRKPRALRQLRALVETIPAPERNRKEVSHDG